MTKIYYLIEIYQKKIGGPSDDPDRPVQTEYTYETTPAVYITDALVQDNDKTILTTTDGFTFNIMNSKDSDGNYRYNENIKVDDMVRIYITSQEALLDSAGNPISNKNDYLRFDGIISETNYNGSIDGTIIQVKGQSRLDRMLNFTWAAVYEPQPTFDSFASTIIYTLLGHVNDGNLNYQIGGGSAAAWAALGNSTTSTPISYNRNYRPIIEMIEELSYQKENKEFNAYYYLDVNNDFIWKEKTKDDDTINVREGYEILTVKIVEKVWEVINACIVDCGDDPSGNAIHAMYYDETSAGQYGLKWGNTIEPQTEFASSIIAQQKQEATTWVNNTDENKQQFPDSSAYPMTLSKETRDSAGNLSGTKAIVTSDKTWKNWVRDEAKWQGIDWIKLYLARTGHVRPKIDIDILGATWEMGYGRTGTGSESCLDSTGDPIQVGDYVKITIPSKGGRWISGSSNPMKMRVIALNHDLNTKGWVVQLHLEIDIDDASSYLATGHQ